MRSIVGQCGIVEEHFGNIAVEESAFRPGEKPAADADFFQRIFRIAGESHVFRLRARRKAARFVASVTRTRICPSPKLRGLGAQVPHAGIVFGAFQIQLAEAGRFIRTQIDVQVRSRNRRSSADSRKRCRGTDCCLWFERGVATSSKVQVFAARPNCGLRRMSSTPSKRSAGSPPRAFSTIKRPLAVAAGEFPVHLFRFVRPGRDMPVGVDGQRAGVRGIEPKQQMRIVGFGRRRIRRCAEIAPSANIAASKVAKKAIRSKPPHENDTVEDRFWKCYS